MAKIEKQTFSFLEALRPNNNREWFQENRGLYEASLANVKAFIRGIIDALSAFDPHIHTDISESKCLFRIYRDTRFSNDKTPYKTWFSAGISVDGRKLDGPEYYLHIEPGKSFWEWGTGGQIRNIWMLSVRKSIIMLKGSIKHCKIISGRHQICPQKISW